MLLELFLCVFVLVCFIHIQKKRRLPPGPFSIPILGTLDIYSYSNTDKTVFSLFFSDKYIKKPYNDFCTFFLGPSAVLVIINDFKLVKELFSKDEFSGNP